MDSPASHDRHADDSSVTANTVLAEVTCTWSHGRTVAVVVQDAPGVLVLEATDAGLELPALGTLIQVSGEHVQVAGRLAEHGLGGRFLVALGDRPVRSELRLRVKLPATLRSPALPNAVQVEIVDLTTRGARVRGIELPVDSHVTLHFVPPGRADSLSVRAVVVHSTHGGRQPWLGVRFRLVALRGGR
jgi:hypothetical protein